jgi:hypothetical protein
MSKDSRSRNSTSPIDRPESRGRDIDRPGSRKFSGDKAESRGRDLNRLEFKDHALETRRGVVDDRRISMDRRESMNASASGRESRSRDGSPRKRSRSPRPAVRSRSMSMSPESKRYKTVKKPNTVWDAGFFNLFSRGN